MTCHIPLYPIPRLYPIHRLLLLPALVCFGITDSFGSSPELRFHGNTLRVLEAEPPRVSGLEKIYVVYDVNGVSFDFTSDSNGALKVLRFGALGGGFADEVSDVTAIQDGIRVNSIRGNEGYIIEDNGRTYCYWIVEYKPQRFSVNALTPSEGVECDATKLSFSGEASPIHYYSINGQQLVLSRDIEVTYDSQVHEQDSDGFQTIEQLKNLEYIKDDIYLTPPAYCATSFRINGDAFLRQWDWTVEKESVVVEPTAVNIYTAAFQEGRDLSASGEGDDDVEDNPEGIPDDYQDQTSPSDTPEDKDPWEGVGSNVIPSADNMLGGSAPAEVEFTAYGTQGVIHHEWQMSSNAEFDPIDYRFNDQVLNYTFNDEGTFYLRYVGSNSDGSCEKTSDTYTVAIGSSELLCPNAFSPDGDGINDLWRVSYRSLLNFKCWIFDRYGNKIHYFDSPEGGWDGKFRGKYVKPGVYYYVINAEGADGKKYKKSGDINILRHRSVTNQTEPSQGS